MSATMLGAALEYVAQGLAVLPLHSSDREGRCSCGSRDCASPGKHPRTPNGVKGATLDPEILHGWWARWPSAWIGIATGAASGGLWVLDVDLGAPVGGGLAGPEAVALLEAQHGALPATWRASTGSGGWHLWWRSPVGVELPGNRVGVRVEGQACGIDVRSSGGYVVAPPSGHYSGGVYRWTEREGVAEAPGWLQGLVRRVERPVEPRPAPTLPEAQGDLGREQRYARAALARAVRDVSALQKGVGGGGRHAALLSAARTLGGFARLLEADGARALLVEAGVACGLPEREAARTVVDGWAAGEAAPLPVPDRPAPPSRARIEAMPWTEREQPPLEDDVGRPALRLVVPDDGRWADLDSAPVMTVERETRAADRVVEELLTNGAPPVEPPPMRPMEAEVEAERPQIIVSGQHARDIVDAAWNAVLAEPGLYQRDGRVVRVAGSEHGARIEEVGEGAMSERLSRAADWFSLRPPRRGEVTEGGMVRQPLGAMPRPTVQAMLAVPHRGLPVLDGIVCSPVLDAQGDLVGSPGYHPGARLWYEGAPLRRSRPSTQAAVDLLLGEWLGDFAFASEADRAAALGLLVQMVMRRMIPSACPIHVVEAPVQGSGKDLLVQALATVGLGGVPTVQAWSQSPEERQKKLMAGLLSGAPLLWLGNVTGRLADPTLAAILTAHPVYEDRVLGGSTMGRVTTAGLSVVATVNNAHLDDDLATRAVRVRIDTGLEDPTVGRVFRHRDLIGWTSAHRDELLSAVLALIESARADGAEWSGPVHGRYPAWSRIVGSVVEAAGLGEHWLAHRAATRGLGSLEAQEWAALVAAWAARGGVRSTAGELAVYCSSRELLLGVVGEDPKRGARGLSRALAGMRDRIWTVEGVRWRMQGARQVHGRTAYALDCLDPDGVHDMGARRARGWTSAGELYETRQDGL